MEDLRRNKEPPTVEVDDDLQQHHDEEDIISADDDDNDDNEEILHTKVPGHVPVGITIAYQRKKGGFDALKTERGATTTESKKKRKKLSPSSTKQKSDGNTAHRRTRTNSVGSIITGNQTTRGYKKPVASFTVFLEGTTLYVICLVLPTLLGLLVNFYDDIVVMDWKRDSAAIVKARVHAMKHSFHHNVDDICQYPETLGMDYSYVSESDGDFGIIGSMIGVARRMLRVVYVPVVRWMIQWVSFWFHQSGLCDRVAMQLMREEEEQYFNHFVVSKDTAYWVHDVSIIVVCSMILAALRIWIVQTTVPLEDSTTVEALVRCKSIHLLSSEYAKTMTPISTPMAFKKKTKQMPRTLSGTAREESLTPFLMPDLSAKGMPAATSAEHPQQQFDESYGHDLGMRWDETEREDDHKIDSSFSTSPFMPVQLMKPIDLQTHNVRSADRNNAMMEDADTDDEEIVHVSHQQQHQLLEDKIATSLQSIQSRQQQQEKDDLLKQPLSPTQEELMKTPAEVVNTITNVVGDGADAPPARTRVNAAPRYATAIFRLLWSTVSSVLALYFFRNSNFWPWYGGGSGSTSNCWDLSGGLSVGGMDSDFDHYNSMLKQYFLGQASYHWHSGAFHILSMLILLLHPSTKVRDNMVMQDEFAASPESPHSKQKPSAMRLLFGSSSMAYIRSLSQHALALALIASAYIFSSLRRLGVIGMFSFDVSNWFLHLLQTCMNAPGDSILKKSNVISWVYWLGVVPSFVITRFIIWPLLWYSAIFESQRWLIQLEKTLWIGSATVLRCIFHVWMLLIQILNMVYFYRLLYHPHFNNILKERREQRHQQQQLEHHQ